MDKADILKYAALIINTKGEILLGRKEGKDTWINIGGRVEGSETVIECLQREILEELGCKIITLPEPDIFTETPATPALDDPEKTVKIIWYKVQLLGTPAPQNEIVELLWMNPKDFNQYNLSPQIVEYLIPKLTNL